MGPLTISPVAGRRLAAATAGLRKASELFAHPCPIYSHNERNYMNMIHVFIVERTFLQLSVSRVNYRLE